MRKQQPGYHPKLPEVTELDILIEETIQKEEANEELKKTQSKKLFVGINAGQFDSI